MALFLKQLNLGDRFTFQSVIGAQSVPYKVVEKDGQTRSVIAVDELTQAKMTWDENVKVVTL